ncbi:hypothetical protein GCM10009733_079290 [Nonomuraea maheshkhaliensis]|uniref:Uncharacterized protein n=1 Tax=Nonomuraea maheshkhaliensis TaxID=419590 RepID=A0ABN2GET8_9ACTN
MGGITLGDDDVARSTVTFRTNGAGAVTVTATWAARGADGTVQRLRLSGATSYTRTLTWRMDERPCGRTVTLNVATSPAAPGGTTTASLSVPACPVRVNALGVALSLPEAPGRTATARVRLTASGTGAIPVEARFAVDGEAVGTREATLSGRTSYARAFTHTFRSRPCGSTLSVRVSAGGRTDTARLSVPCPPQVRQVAIVEAGAGAGGITAQVRVTTAGTGPVRLTVRLAAGEGAGTQAVTLSGATSYSRSFTYRAKLPCGSKWSVTAATDPAAAGGGDSRSGATPACQEEEPPKEPPSDRPVEKPQDTPSEKPQEPAKETPRATPKITPRPDSPGTVG